MSIQIHNQNEFSKQKRKGVSDCTLQTSFRASELFIPFLAEPSEHWGGGLTATFNWIQGSALEPVFRASGTRLWAGQDFPRAWPLPSSSSFFFSPYFKCRQECVLKWKCRLLKHSSHLLRNSNMGISYLTYRGGFKLRKCANLG